MATCTATVNAPWTEPVAYWWIDPLLSGSNSIISTWHMAEWSASELFAPASTSQQILNGQFVSSWPFVSPAARAAKSHTVLPLDCLTFPKYSRPCICSYFIAWLKWTYSATCMCLRFSAFIIPTRHFGFSHRVRDSANALSRSLLSYDPFAPSSLKMVIVRIFVFA